MTHYLAFTLGPIFDTLSHARKTRELWAASYIFSVLMRELLAELKSRQIIKPDESNLLAPLVGKRIKNGSGIYPDRCYLEIDSKVSAEDIKKILAATIDRVSNLLPRQDNGFNPAGHFRIYAAQIPAGQRAHSAILKLNEILDTLELQPLVSTDNVKLVSILENNIHKLYDDAGRNTVFITYKNKKGYELKRLPSLLELATSELNQGEKAIQYSNVLTEPTNTAVANYEEEKQSGINRAEKHETDAQEQALRKLKAPSAFGDAVKFRHKYVCFVKADGDSVGKTIGAIGNSDDGVREFSAKLGEFADAAVNKIISFGAIPVYAGGDDLLFIAPVQNALGKHIFDLLSQIDGDFPGDALKAIGKKHNPGFDVLPTLSYGLSIGYYKYPMSESLKAMDELLFDVAKNFREKNAVSFRVLKHSGQAFGTTLTKSKQENSAFQKFSKLLMACRGQETAFLTSVMHRLSDLKPLLEDALKNENLGAFFKHHFNESEHSASAAQNYLKAVRGFAEAAWAEEKAASQSKAPEIETVVGQLYAALRFVQFLNQEDHD